jgi:hypothetical protein
MPQPKAAEPFKTCPLCNEQWLTREDFLADPHLECRGYQVNLDLLHDGLFFFVHGKPGCGTGLAIDVSEFIGLYNGKTYIERIDRTSECPGHCFDKEDLRPCKKTCACAFIRDLLQVIREWPKRKPV